MYANASGTLHSSITQLKAQTECKAEDRIKFPLFTLTNASKFLAQFRSTSPIDYEVRCASGEYQYDNGQSLSHVDVSEGGRSRIIVEGVRNTATFDFSKIISDDNQAYLTTFTFPVAFGNVSSGSINTYGNVVLRYLNLGYREATINPLGQGDVTASEIPTYCSNQSSFIKSYGQIQFDSMYAFGMGYLCYNCEGQLSLNSIGVSKDRDGNLPGMNSVDNSVKENRTIANMHKTHWPIQIDTTMSGIVFGSYSSISVSTGTYMRIIGKHNVDSFLKHDDGDTNLYRPNGGNRWAYIFGAQGDIVTLVRRQDNPTRIDVCVDEYNESADDIDDTSLIGNVKMRYVMFNAGSRFNWGSAHVTGYPIADNSDSYAIYWHNSLEQNGELSDAISLLKGYNAGVGNPDLQWGFSDSGVFLDGQSLFNRFFHFKNTVDNNGNVIDLSDDFYKSGDETYCISANGRTYKGRKASLAEIEESGTKSNGNVYFAEDTRKCYIYNSSTRTWSLVYDNIPESLYGRRSDSRWNGGATISNINEHGAINW